MFRRRLLTGLVTALLPLGLSLLVPTAAHAQKDGFYNVIGNGPDGSSYNGTLAMHRVGEVSWQVLWETSIGRYEGYAMSTKDNFAVGFTAGGQPGLAVYKIMPNGTLVGQWTLVGTDQVGTETLSFRGNPPPGAQAAPPAQAQPARPAAPAQGKK